MDTSFLEWYAKRRAERPLCQKQEWTLVALNRPIPQGKADSGGPELLSSCMFTCLMAGVGGYLMGAAFGFVFFAMEHNDIDSSLAVKSQFKQSYRGMWTRMKSSGKSFGSFGALFVAFECPLERFRGVHDHWNSLNAGFLTGAVLARIQKVGIKGTLFGGLSCGLFCGLIEMVMNR